MSQREFEDHIRREIQEHATPVDGEALWRALEPQLRKRKRRGLWWLCLLAGILVVGGVWYGVLSSTNTAGLDQEVVAPTETHNDVALARPDQTRSDVISTTSPTTRTETRDHALATRIATKNEQNNAAITSASTDKRTGNQEADINSAVNPGLSAHEPISQRVEKSSTEVNLPLPEAAIMTPAVRAQNRTENQQANTENRVQANAKAVETTKDELANSTIPSAFSSIQPLPLLQPYLMSPLHKLSNPVATPVATIRTPDLTKRASPFHFAVGLQAGMANSSRTLLAKTEDANLYRDRRKASETPLEVLSTSADIWLHHRSGLYLRTGLQLSQFTERFDYNQSTITTDSTIGITEIFIDSQGDSTFTEGLIALQREVQYKKRNYNTLRLLDVPLIVGYEFMQAPFSFGVEVGAYFNVQLAGAGAILSADEADGFLDLADDTVLRPRVGLSYYGAIRISYQLGTQWQLSVSPYFRHFPQSFTKDSYELEQNYQVFGGRLGIKYYFR